MGWQIKLALMNLAVVAALVNRGDEAAWMRTRIAFLPGLVGVGID